MIVHNDQITLGFSGKDVTGEELEAQLKLFVQIAKTAGYKITKKIIIHHNGYGIVDVEGKKEI